MLANEWKKNAISVMDKIEETQMENIRKVAEIMAKELGESQQWIDNQIDSFVKLASNYFVDC